MQARRIAVWVTSLLIGLAGASAIVFLFFKTTLDRYKIWFPGDNYLVLIIAIGALAWIWLDYFLGTEMLPK
jgi:hypothetical protein